MRLKIRMDGEQTMTISRNVGAAKGSSRSSSPAHGNSSAKDVKQQTNLNSSVVSAMFDALDAIPTSSNRTTGSPCSIKRLRAVLPTELGDKVLMMIDTSEHTATDIAKTLAQFNEVTGIRITSWIVQKHRRRLKQTGCSCLQIIGKT